MKIKMKILGVLSLILIGSMSLFAQSQTKNFKVLGNCDMCVERIEKAANSVNGVTKSSWNKETKMMKVTFDESKTDMNKIKKAIANVGHDTNEFKAKNEVYNKLPNSCKYERAKKAGCGNSHKPCSSSCRKG